MPDCTPAMFHILLALADGERHGLGIVAETEERTGREVKLGPGILYGSIKKLLSRGWIEEAASRPAGDDPRRRYYRITRTGRRVLAEEAERLATLVAVARDKEVIGGRPR